MEAGMVKRLLAATMAIGMVTAMAKPKFLVSFGDGGLKKYEIVDNTCYVYTIKYPKKDTDLPKVMNDVLVSSVINAQRQYGKKGDGFINIRVSWQVVGKERLIYQVCGDIVRRK